MTGKRLSALVSSGLRAQLSRWQIWVIVGVLAVGVLLLGVFPWTETTTGDRARSSGVGEFTGDRKETERFLAYGRSITLTPAQEAIKQAALEALPAPCCKQFTAATCCCKCNMARATWGLAKHLVADQGLDVSEVRDRVAAWHRAINPKGFSGDSCFVGGCQRSFADNGCGGMLKGHLVF